ncbi:hypothetical protein L208DRAFT_1329412, partial [Tricholoma matsutake]
SRMPTEYLSSLNDKDLTTAYRACLLAWNVTGGTQVPREMQLHVTLATYNGSDSLINAGTGSGKTLPIALNLLLDNPLDNCISLTISPLKQLQVTQENDFNTKYQIHTVSINNDMPRNDAYWKEHVHNLKTCTPGSACHIIVTVEQLFKTPEGHYLQLAVLLWNCHFQKQIKRVHVDEAHSIYLAGLACHGLLAFQPAWGKLDELKAILPSSVPWQALSATFPPHILKTIKTKILRPNYASIQVSANRPNTIYATHQVVTSLETPQNYDCFLMTLFDLASQPHVLIFFDDTDLASKIVEHLDKLLPMQYRDQGAVQHYHSGMSEIYLQCAHLAFTEQDGICKVLCATSGESPMQGVDFPDVKIVCNAGLPGNIVDSLQCRGHVGQHNGDQGLFVIFYEPWVTSIHLEQYEGSCDDPDQPQGTLKPTSLARDCASRASVKLMQCEDCRQLFFADYLGDKTPSDNLSSYTLNSTTALHYETMFCCDDHNDGFVLANFLPGPLFSEKPPIGSSKRKKGPCVTYQKIVNWPALDSHVIEWLQNVNSNDLLHGIQMMYNILSFLQRLDLVHAHSRTIQSPQDITKLLEETEEWSNEWAEPLFLMISQYDKDIGSGNRKKQMKKGGQ